MTNTLSAYLEQEIMSADPLQLVCMLYQAAIMEVREARRYLAAANVPARCAAISKASNIVGELASSLDPDAGRELSERLASLYGYLLNRLLDANLKKADAPLAEVLGLLITLSEGWQGAVAEKRTHTAIAPRATAYPTPFVPGHVSEPVSQSWTF
jgi:flagellar protein FliS